MTNQNPASPYVDKSADLGVLNKDGVKDYIRKRKEWEDLLIHDEHHSIQAQLCIMLWNDRLCKIVRKAAEITHTKQENAACLNGPLIGFIRQSYISTQIFSIRRLIDSRKGNVSLLRLIQDIKNERKLITRENYVCHDGLPYSSQREDTAPWQKSKDRHLKFDLLAKINRTEEDIENNIGRDDLICPKILDNLLNELEGSDFNKLKKLSDKFFAHAANVKSRESIEDHNLAMQEIRGCQKKLWQITHFLSTNIFYGGDSDYLPVPQYDYWEHLTQPWVSQEIIKDLYAFWGDYRKEIDAWRSYSFT